MGWPKLNLDHTSLLRKVMSTSRVIPKLSTYTLKA